jgi:hypothetical protein
LLRHLETQEAAKWDLEQQLLYCRSAYGF